MPTPIGRISTVPQIDTTTTLSFEEALAAMVDEAVRVRRTSWPHECYYVVHNEQFHVYKPLIPGRDTREHGEWDGLLHPVVFNVADYHAEDWVRVNPSALRQPALAVRPS